MKYGLIGNPLGHSRSPFLHEFFGTAPYDLVQIAESDLDAFFARRDFAAINVTIPYKRAVMSCLNGISAVAEECDAVNTVVNRDGKLYGFNTDLFGMEFSLARAGIALKGKNVVILGSGGTSHTAQVLARHGGAQSVKVVSRTGQYNYRNLLPVRDAEVLFNTTPVGMFPDMAAAPVDLDCFPALEGIFDAVYNPLRTRLVQQAEARGIKHADGLLMLAAQAKASSDLFRGVPMPSSDDADAARTILAARDALRRSLTNIILVGMPGSGKTTVGAAVARLLGRDFYDADAEIVKATGKSIPDIFAEEGEEGFRRRESETVRALSEKQGAVIATGGGAPLRDENRLNLRANGFVVYLVRDLSALPTEGRPLSLGADLGAMYRDRHPVYSAFADITVDNSAAPEDAAREITEKFNESSCD